MYKVFRQYNKIVTCIKNYKYNICVYRKENYQCVVQKYYTIYTVKKKKCTTCKKLSPKYTTDSNFFS